MNRSFTSPGTASSAPVSSRATRLLGVVGGIASAAFSKLLLGLRLWFLRLPVNTRWVQPVVGGLTVGAMGFFVPDVLGVGYPSVDSVLGGSMVLKVVVLLAVLKLIATAVCYASGNAGGIFGPSLFIGAMLGAAVGHLAHAISPAHTAGPGAYALVGMGAMFAGTVRTPLTSVIMIFELTRDYSVIVPLMISNLIAFFVSHRLQPQTIYEALAQQDGLHLPTGTFRTSSKELRVESAMRPVTDATTARTDGVAGDDTLHVHRDHPLSVALQRMGEARRDSLPVVSRQDARIVVGVIALVDVLAAYGVARELNPTMTPASDHPPPAGVRPD